MANALRPTGLSPVGTISGASWNQQAHIYSIAANYAKDLYVGDPVISSGSADAEGVPGIALAAVTGALRGVIVGVGSSIGLLADPSNLDITYWPKNTAHVGYALVVDDPNTLFEVQDSGTAAIPLTKFSSNANLTLGTGNGFVSGWSITSAGVGTEVTRQVKIFSLPLRPDNVPGVNQKLVVKINNHELAAGTVSS